MKKMILLFFMVSTTALATDLPPSDVQPEQAAQAFNQWYMQQIDRDKFPITDSQEIERYVTSDTLNKLRRAQTPEHADDEYYDADFFIKAQDWDKDWVTSVTVLFSDYDPVCMNVYVAFGESKQHVVADCYVKENGVWKIQSVSLASASELVHTGK